MLTFRMTYQAFKLRLRIVRCSRQLAPMVSFVLNVRVDQLDITGNSVHLPRFSLPAALDAAGHEALLFASRDERGYSYYATALLGEPMPDKSDDSRYLLALYNLRPLLRPITLRELRALGVSELPFHIYSRPLLSVPDEEQRALVKLGAIPEGFGEKDIQLFELGASHRVRLVNNQDGSLRFEMYKQWILLRLYTSILPKPRWTKIWFRHGASMAPLGWRTQGNSKRDANY